MISEAKPFVKWAGGKTRVLDTLIYFISKQSRNQIITTYIEPFLGGGSLFFYLVQNYNFSKYIISDINSPLIATYQAIKDNLHYLSGYLEALENRYYDTQNKKVFFEDVRSKFNEELKENSKYSSPYDKARIAGKLIFLNKTCFNGLYRLNSKGEFNTSYGKYKKPKIFDEDNLKAVSKVLQRCEIYNLDFWGLKEYINDKCIVYLDPPYKPLSETANFTSYTSQNFTDSNHERLVRFCDYIDSIGGKFILSNSDQEECHALYCKYQIEKYQNLRSINSNGSKRGGINEILVKN